MAKLRISDSVHRPLSAWVHGSKFYMRPFFYYENEEILPEEIFVSLDTFFQIHEAAQVPLKTLEQSWSDTRNYVASACKLLGRAKAGYSLSPEERDKVVATIGQPPEPAWPLYFFTVGDFPTEEIVYIGKTNSTTHRFYSGHSAITALHHPDYLGLSKRLYLATVTIYSDEGNYVPLEWLHPKTLRDAIWSDVEAQLIFHFQPKLNTDLKASDYSKKPVQMAIHNYSGTKSFDVTYINAHRMIDANEWVDLL